MRSYFLVLLLGCFLQACASAPHTPVSPDCVLIDTDASLDDFRALAALAPNIRIAGVITTEGVTRSGPGAVALRHLINLAGDKFPVWSGGAAPNPPKPKWLAKQRNLDEGLNSLWEPEGSIEPAPLINPAELESAIGGCRQVTLLVLGPRSSLKEYWSKVAHKVDRVVMQGRPLAETKTKPGFNCRYDIEACRYFEGLFAKSEKLIYVDIPRKGPEFYAPTVQMVENLDENGWAGAIRRVHQADTASWLKKNIRMWDDAAALFLLCEECFVGVGKHLEPSITPEAFRKLWSSSANGHAPSKGKILGAKRFLTYLHSLKLGKNWSRFQRAGYGRCAVFDADGTLWKGDFSGEFVKQAIDQKEVSPGALRPINGILTFFDLEPGKDVYDAIRRLRNSRRDKSIYESGRAKGLSKFETEKILWPWWNYLFTGLNGVDVDRRMRTFFSSDIQPKVFPEIEKIIAYLREEEFDLFIISAGMDMPTKIGAEFLKVPPARSRGVKTKTINGVITSEVIKPITHKGGKAELSREFCGGNPFIVFGDSVTSTDSEMLSIAHIAVAVEPKPHHARGAFKNGYIVLDLERTRDGSPADTFQRKK